MADLYSRIKRLKSVKPARSAAPVTPGPDAPASLEVDSYRGLDDWGEIAPLVYRRVTSEDLPHDVAAIFDTPLLLLSITGGHPAASGSPTANDAVCGVSGVRFMDTETTGLSGGAGTTVFLVGSATVRDGRVEVKQTLLADFPGEPRFLEAVAEDLRAPTWVSYNGKAFDSRLLESRFLMNGMAPLVVRHVDLLYWARRLWRTMLRSCSLGDIERDILGRGRADDIPGIEIPDRYFDFLRDADAAQLRPVFEHHRIDIVSLVHLLARVERVLRKPLEHQALDHFQLGRFLLSHGDERGLGVLERSCADAGSESARAALFLARAYRRRGDDRHAERILTGALERVDPPRALGLVTELAKVYEHDRRDPLSALAVIDEYRERSGEDPPPELAHREERLRRKAGAG